MKQIIAQIIVALVILLVVGFFVYIFRARRGARKAGSIARADLARELGASAAPAKPGLSGTFGGRPCTLYQTRRPGSDDQQPYVHIQIACAAPTTFQVHRSRPSLLGVEAPDLVRTGHEEFDAQIMVRSDDPGRATAVLTEELRSRLLDWFGRGQIDTIWLKNGELLIDGGHGFEEGWEVELARQLLQAGVQIADRLEHR